MLEVSHLNYYYGKKQVLKDVNFTLGREEVCVFLGPNGSGKSTLLRCMAGMIVPQEGKVFLENKELIKYRTKQLARKICFLPQTLVSLEYISVYDFVALGRSPHQALGWMLTREDKERIDWALGYMQLRSSQHRLLDSLSGGERQRVWISMILVQDAPVILMDEPVTFLDLKFQWDLIAKIREIRRFLHKSFIVVLHDVNHAMALADRVLVLKEGEICALGSPDKVITPRLIEDVYGIQADMGKISDNPHPVIVPRQVIV